MSVQNILDDNGKIDPAYIPDLAPFGYVRNPLTAPLQCFNPTTLTNHPIVEAGYVSASAIKTDNLEQLPGSLQNSIRCQTNIEMESNKQLDFQTNALLTIGGNASRKAFYTEDATPLVGFAKFFVGGGNAVEYAESTKVLTVNKPTVPPSPLLPGQGAVIYGDVSVSGLVDGTDLKLKGTNPSVDFYNSSNVQKASLDYVELTDKITLSGTNVVLESTGTGAPRVLLDAVAGSAELRGNNIAVRARRYSATGTTLQTDLTLNANGQATLTAPVNADDAILRFENAGGKYGEIIASENNGTFSVKAQSGYGLELESTGNQITMKPSTGIVEIVGDETIGSPPTLKFTDSGLPRSIDMTMRTDGFGFGTGEIASTAGFFSVSTGAVEGIAIGTTTTENLIMGYGLPLKISNSFATLPLQWIELQNGGIINITSVNPAVVEQTLTAIFDPATNIQLTINDALTSTGATIDLFGSGEVAISATGVLNQTADSANLSITNDLTMSALQTVISGGGVRFNQSRMNPPNPILPTDYAITYTQVGAFTRTLPAVSSANIGQKYIITNSGIGTLTLSASGAQLIYSNGTATNSRVITPNNTYTLTAIQSATTPLYGWSMVGAGTTPLVSGSFSSTATQTATLANTTYFATYTTSDITAQNCSFVGSEITISQVCSKVRIQSSIIITSVSPTTSFRFWLVKNGANVPNTASLMSIKDAGQNLLAMCEWNVSSAVGDKFKVAYQSDTAGATITANVAGGVAPNDYPASPSIITTIQGFQ